VSRNDDDADSTLLRVGRSAVTFSDMEAFVHELEARPHGRLVSDLSSLLSLPAAKFDLCVMVLRRRLRTATDEQRSEILDGIRSAGEHSDAEVTSRAKELAAKFG
jgi:hypothetical protein